MDVDGLFSKNPGGAIGRAEVAAAIAALFVRLMFVILLHDAYFYAGMSLNNGEAARNLAENRGLAVDEELIRQVRALQLETQRLIDLQDVPSSDTEPERVRYLGSYALAYPTLLAATYKVFGQYRYVYLQLLQVLVDSTVSVALCTWLGQQLGGRRVGLIAGFLYALWLPLSRLCIAALPDAWMPLLTLILVTAVVRGLQTDRWYWFLLAGLVTGIATHFRSDILTVMLFMSLAIVAGGRRWRRSLLRGAMMLGLALILLLPFGWIQQRALGDFALGRPVFGGILLEGIGEYENRWGVRATDAYLDTVLEEAGLTNHTPEGNAFLLSKALDMICQDPAWYAGTVARRMLRIAFLMKFDWGPLSLGARYFPHPSYSDFQASGGTGLLAYLKAHPLHALIRLAAGPPLLLDFALVSLVLLGAWLTRRQPMTALLMSVPLSRLLFFCWLHVEWRWIVWGWVPTLPLAAVGIKWVSEHLHLGTRVREFIRRLTLFCSWSRGR
jgi:hypothetical protein